MNNKKFTRLEYAICAGMIILLVALGIAQIMSRKSLERDTENWKQFSDQYLGISFEHPRELQGYYAKEITFRDCEECPGSLNIKAEIVGDTTVEDIVLEKIQADTAEDTKTSETVQIIVDRTVVDGNPAIITTSANPNVEENLSRTIFVMHKDVLYTINTRWIDTDRLLQTLRFLF